jgi:Stress responsive A/B Barrel Domain
MIRHVACFAWAAEATAAQRQQVAEELRALPALMRGLRAYHFGTDAGLADGNYDFAVVADFDDTESYFAYRDHPAHRAIVEEVIRPITRHRASVQYQF